MKTYLFDTFNRYKRFSEELDAKTFLCNKSWWVFNDSGEKEVYIYNTDGTLIIAVSGKVTNATWQYITANKSLIISGNNQSYMVKPAFFDNQIFALQVDGTNDYAFLIDENNLPSTSLRSLADLKEHFAEKERQAVLAEERKQQAALEAQRQREITAQQEKQEKIKEAEEDYDVLGEILSFLAKGCVIYLNWYFVPTFLRFLCLNILGISEESYESSPYVIPIFLSIELTFAIIILFKIKTLNLMWGIVQFILLILLLCISK